MIDLSETQQVHVYIDAIDMRKSINGLIVLLIDGFADNPQTGDLFVFTNKSRNKIKILCWDYNGFVLYYKRLEKGRFLFSKDLCGQKIMINKIQLKALLMGIDFYLLARFPAEKYKDFY